VDEDPVEFEALDTTPTPPEFEVESEIPIE